MGCKPKPIEVKRLLNELSADQVKRIQKWNPFRKQRNAAIRELLDQGVKATVIAAVSGLGDTTIGRIKKRDHKLID